MTCASDTLHTELIDGKKQLVLQPLTRKYVEVTAHFPSEIAAFFLFTVKLW